MSIAIAISLIVFALICSLLAVIGLPGTWLMITAVLVIEWFEPERFTWTTIGVLIGLAVLAEVLEFLSGAIGTAKAGGSKRAALGATVGGLAGAIVGSPIFPIIGTIIGSILGAGAGAILLESTKRSVPARNEMQEEESARAGTSPIRRLRRVGAGAAVGRTLSILIKGATGLAMTLTIAITAWS
ncbi:MAG: DUF456 domain-containing protein [Planctomycetota bacterium]